MKLSKIFVTASVRQSPADAAAAVDPGPDSHRVVQLPGLRVRRHVLPEGRPDGDHRRFVRFFWLLVWLVVAILCSRVLLIPIQ